MRPSIIWRTDQGAFHVGKSSASTGLNANETPGSTGNFSEQTDDPTSYSTFSVPTGWNRNSGSICAILFRPKAGTWTFFRLFQCLALSVDHGLSQFFFSFLIVSFKMASVQNSCELCQGSNFLKRNSNKLPLFPLLARKPSHLTRKISGISNRKFSLNGKRLGHHLEAWGYKLQWFLKLSTLAPKPGPRFIV